VPSILSDSLLRCLLDIDDGAGLAVLAVQHVKRARVAPSKQRTSGGLLDFARHLSLDHAFASFLLSQKSARLVIQMSLPQRNTGRECAGASSEKPNYRKQTPLLNDLDGG
jgi:hypothetical protein